MLPTPWNRRRQARLNGVGATRGRDGAGGLGHYWNHSWSVLYRDGQPIDASCQPFWHPILDHPWYPSINTEACCCPSRQHIIAIPISSKANAPKRAPAIQFAMSYGYIHNPLCGLMHVSRDEIQVGRNMSVRAAV
jgi:hypothetical protein